MIFRKPYAFLIKRFKLIHLLLSSMMIYLIYKTSKIVNYFNEYIDTNAGVKNLASNYFNKLMFVLVLLIIIGSIIVYFLFRYKNKPKIIYLITIIGYFVCFIIFYNSFSILKELETELLDSKTVRLWRDLITFSLYFQYGTLVVMLVRGLGFDIKKFNFQSDLKELKINYEDNEEFEFDISSSGTKIAREGRKLIRNLKYFYLEHRFILIIIISLIFIVLITLFIINIFVINKTYNEKEWVKTSKYSIRVVNSYYVNKNSKGDYLSSLDDIYLVMLLDIKNNDIDNKTFNITDFRVKIGNYTYYPSNKLCSHLKDIGNCYFDYKITSDSKTYMFIYQISKDDVLKSSTLYYEDYYVITNKTVQSNYKKIKLSPVDLTKVIKNVTVNLSDNLEIDNNFVKEISLNISNYDMNTRYFHNIDDTVYTIITNNLYSDKIILKMKIDYQGDISINYLIDKYLTLSYKIDDSYYVSDIVNKTPSEVNDYVYLEVSRDIVNASSLVLNFNMYNYQYMYVLK